MGGTRGFVPNTKRSQLQEKVRKEVQDLLPGRPGPFDTDNALTVTIDPTDKKHSEKGEFKASSMPLWRRILTARIVDQLSTRLMLQGGV